MKKTDSNSNVTDEGNNQSMFTVTVLRWPIMKKAIAKLTNTQLSKLQYATKYKTGTALRITKKNF